MSLINSLRFIANHPLNRGSAYQSLLRFARWQIGGRLIPGTVVHDWVRGSRFLVRTGETGLTGNIYTGLHEFADMGYVLHALRDSDLFVDAGANVGSYTILACAAAGARGYAFEPAPSAYDRLVDNVRLNRLESRVKCLNIGVGRSEGVVRFTSSMDTTNHVLAAGEQARKVIDVSVCALDTALDSESPTMVKIDVEGYETAVVEGAQSTLKKASLHSVIMELNGSGSRYGYDESRILEMMSDYGFKTYSYDPLNRSLTNLAGKNAASDNTLFIRDVALAAEKIATAAKVRILGKEF